ncbi:hypothetical protein IMG5_002250 [Ichthyophthirius multifiliis]|uniref:beta-N-acetylhexosaminidase n=1 Tax=Ichthyophthirius multifiliis TaxID=5932 RepID=G0QJ28_ICHMU|nr:hypothetical protein IMG5_002250 [Ichthyophthirius multifiliis]EGR34752.1 hypothetical protein IMG5_002250 [Ichthyophthirius multifiliis]|eukprot:XP_004040056.1 hypothetical protein IMG5_002250 [Ichthyophthirius multifiliis]
MRAQEIFFIFFLISLITAKATDVDPISQKVLPKPKNYTYGTENFVITDPCIIQYKPLGQKIPSQVYEIIDFYKTKIFQQQQSCQQQKRKLLTKIDTIQQQKQQHQQQQIIFEINIKDTNITTSKSKEDEKYTLKLVNSTYWSLDADKYVGFLRGIETYSQLIEKNQTSGQFFIQNLPIQIDDMPDYFYRGLMIDTSRHFFSVKSILDTIDSMLYNKLNFLHWHITDADSFPFPLKSFPNITTFGSLSSYQQYTFDDVQKIITYGILKGVQIIPEIDSPGHTLSWGKSQQFQNITLNCGGYQGQLDPSLDQTYEALKGILEDMKDQFSNSDFVHFGGDEVDEQCWDQRVTIKQFMEQKKISTYSQLQDYYRFEQKKLWRNISKKPVIYWANDNINVQEDDIIQWWGYSNSIANILKGKKIRLYCLIMINFIQMWVMVIVTEEVMEQCIIGMLYIHLILKLKGLKIKYQELQVVFGAK